MFLFVCLQFCGCSTDNIGVFGTFGCKTLAIMLICIGDGIRDSLIKVYVYSPIIRYFGETSFNLAVMSCAACAGAPGKPNRSAISR